MPLTQKRLLQLFAFLAAWAIVVVLRLVQIQLVRHDHYVARAKKQQERTVALDPVRGSILDARGRVLAESVAAESIYADPQVISDRKATAKKLASVQALGMTAREIEAKLRAGGSFTWIARQLPLETTAAVRKLKLPGIYFLEAHRRSYPRHTLAANIIGYVGIDGEGLGGIEHSLDEQIQGAPGKVTLLQDARAGMYLVGGDGPNAPRDGHDVVLTIDSVVQYIAERALQRAVEKANATGGSVVVMDPSNGSILAMASYPTFDPNRFRAYPAAAWRNRNVQDLYEPGSTFKIVAASAGLEERLVTPSQMVDCNNGSIRIANVEIREHGGNRYGMMSFEDVLVHSSNVGTIKVALGLGQTRFYSWIRKFGFGERTGLELPGEAIGLLRPTQKWSAVSNASMAIGQEIAVTPLQIVRAMAVVANGGVRVEPRIVEKVVDEDGKTLWQPKRAEPLRVTSEKTAAVMNEILKQVVLRGTGSQAQLEEHIVAGKTGTAQKASRGGYSADKFVASFAGYVPADQPRLAMLVVVDEPRGGHYGGAIAAPVFREVAEATLRYLGVPPSRPTRSIAPEGTLLAAFSQREPVASAAAAVPDLRGLDARAAIAAAVRRGFAVQAIGSGVVISQSPEPGGALPANKRLTLKMSEVRG
ncbi:MAG TPA: penicillin-binding transpeptidase domain-containing protein [Thermoanaerobaculia bacterium]|jgi:cell division protein FtsI (penicillin-binding protein 3)